MPISAQHRTAVTRQLTVLARDRASVSVACTALRSSSRRPASSAHNEFDDETRPPWTMLQSSPAFVALTCSVSLQAGHRGSVRCGESRERARALLVFALRCE